MPQTSSKYHKTTEQIRSEQDEIEAAKKNPARFEVLYNRYYEQIFRFIYQRVDDIEVAHDCTSQTFLKALTNLHKYEFRGLPFASWLYRVARNELYRHFREKQKDRTVNIETNFLEQLKEDIEEYTENDILNPMKKLLAELDEDNLMLIEMRYFEQRSYKEIGEILDITENNAKVKVFRVIDKLRKKLNK